MPGQQEKEPLDQSNAPSWEDDGGTVGREEPRQDLNSLLAQEQTSIMNAEAAAGPAMYELHRRASIHTRELIDATPYPQHQPHVFVRERAEKAERLQDTASDRAAAEESSERRLARQFANGEVSSSAFQTRMRFVRQERTKSHDAWLAGDAEEDL